MIHVNCKEGIWFRFITFEFLVLARIVYRVFQKYGIIPVVTSACDGKHRADSWHYQGLGWDWRIWGMDDPKTPIDEVKKAADEIRREVQAIDYHYDVVYGDKDHLDHIHTEYDLNKKEG
jgi:hypothetical protein